MRVLLAVLLVVAPLAAASGARTDSRAYVAGPGDLVAPVCLAQLPAEVGGACFLARAGESRVVLSIRDAAGSPPIHYEMLPIAGPGISGDACDTTAPLALAMPPGTLTLKVRVGDAQAVLSCALGKTPGTTGTIDATFS